MKRSRTPLPAKSKKTAVRDEARRELSLQWLAEAREASELGIPECEIQWDLGCQGEATHAHEPRSRKRGGDILDRQQCLLTCLYCHSAVHLATGEDLERAYRKGYLIHSWEAMNDDG